MIWHFVAEGVLFLMVAGMACAVLFLLVACFARRKGGIGATLDVAEKDVKKFATTSLGNAVIVDAKQLAASLAKELKTVPPAKLADHPALTAVSDVIQESTALKNALSQVAAIPAVASAVEAALSTKAS